MSFPGVGFEPSEEEIVLKAGLAEQAAKDAVRKTEVDYRSRPGYWPSAATVVRVALVLFVALIAIGWLLTALNH